MRAPSLQPSASIQTVLPLLATVITLMWAYMLRAPCTRPWTGQQFSDGCYNDIQALFGARDLAHAPFPYLHGGFVAHHLQGGALEYPVLTGSLIWGLAQLVSDSAAYLQLTALVLGLAALATSFLLTRMAGTRTLAWAAAPALALYAFYNWDVLPVLASVAAFYAWSRGRPILSAALFGVGADLKLYPALFLIVLVVELISRGERRVAITAAMSGAGAIAVVNLPFVIANPSGWLATYQFQAGRGADLDTLSVWFWTHASLSPRMLNLVALLLTFATLAAVIVWALRHAHRTGSFPFLQACAAVTAGFVLWNKVASLQYAIWILPFFALLHVRARWWLAFTAADLTLYWGYMRFVAGPDEPFGLANQALVVGAWWGFGVLIALVIVFQRSTVSAPPEQLAQLTVSASAV